jgi:signal transduction histidine kinase
LDSSVEMRVVDDGRGFDLTQVLRAKKGIGLATIQERVRWLGGKVVIQSQPAKGAELTLSIPLSI